MNEQRIVVITDSGTDTPADFAAAHDVRVIPLRINYSDGSTYENGVDITAEEVVERFAEEIPSTSLPSPMKVRDTLERAGLSESEMQRFDKLFAKIEKIKVYKDMKDE